MRSAKENFLLVLSRALHLRCPRCGKGKIFQRWSLPFDECGECAFPFSVHEADTWFFMYISTAGMTGVFLILFFLVPHDSLAVRICVPAAAALFFVLTHPVRKSLAFALNYWMHPEN